MKTTTSPYDMSDHLHRPVEMAAYLEWCVEEPDCDALFVGRVLGDIAQSQGISTVANQIGLSEVSLLIVLYEEENPSFDIILNVVSALGLKLCASVNT